MITTGYVQINKTIDALGSDYNVNEVNREIINYNSIKLRNNDDVNL